ncbi:hypothetical protein KC323_g96 [Hortaea werneckii]|nr:hypothetical protein KC323_g96 [Hortaea werneckii]
MRLLSASADADARQPRFIAAVGSNPSLTLAATPPFESIVTCIIHFATVPDSQSSGHPTSTRAIHRATANPTTLILGGMGSHAEGLWKRQGGDTFTGDGGEDGSSGYDYGSYGDYGYGTYGDNVGFWWTPVRIQKATAVLLCCGPC